MKNRTHPYKLVLGERANTVFIAVVQRNRVEAGSLLRVIVENTLADFPSDVTLEPAFIEGVQELHREGTLDHSYWAGKKLPARYDGATVDHSEGQGEAPDDVPEYHPPDHCLRDKWGRHHIDLDLSPAAYASVVLVKEYEEHRTIEKSVRSVLAGNVRDLAASEAFAEWLDAQFDLGE